jgi:hypothetical protein
MNKEVALVLLHRRHGYVESVYILPEQEAYRQAIIYIIGNLNCTTNPEDIQVIKNLILEKKYEEAYEILDAENYVAVMPINTLDEEVSDTEVIKWLTGDNK